MLSSSHDTQVLDSKLPLAMHAAMHAFICLMAVQMQASCYCISCMTIQLAGGQLLPSQRTCSQKTTACLQVD